MTQNKNNLYFATKFCAMKKENIRELLGFTQEELAQHLEVSRSQLSLYELGKRKLPTTAINKLTKLLSIVSIDDSKEIEINNEYANIILRKLIQSNCYQKIKIEHKIKTIIDKQKAIKTTKKIADYIKDNDNDFKKNEIKFIERIASKNETKFIQTEKLSLLELQIKKEVLECEEKLLNKYLKNLVKTQSPTS